MPCELMEVMLDSPGICPNCRSSDAVIRVDHSGRAGAGKLSGDLDGREIDLRQRRQRQCVIAQQPHQQHRDRQQRSRKPAAR